MVKRIVSVILLIIVILSVVFSLSSCNEKKVETEGLIDKFNTYLEEIMNDGTFEEIENKWASTNELDKDVDYSKLTGENGTLIFGTKTALPFVYRKNNKYVGFVIDIVVRFCEKYGYNIKMKDFLDSNSLVMATSMGKVDFAGANISINKEREESVDFSLPFMKNSGMVLVRKEDEKRYNGISDLSGHSIGTITGTIYPKRVTELNPDIAIYEYNNVADLFEALETGKVDSIVNDQAQNQFILSSHPDVRQVFTIVDNDLYGFVFPKQKVASDNSTKLNKELNQFIKGLSTDGKLDNIKKLWFEYSDSATINYSKLTGKNGIITAAVVEFKPFVYVRNGKYVGLTMDILYRFCLEKGYKLNLLSFKDVNSSLAAISTGKADIAASAISVTAERSKQVGFSTSYFVNTGSVFSLRDKRFKSVDDLKGLKVGTVTGSIYPDIVREKIPGSRLYEYNGIPDVLEALDTKKIDAMVCDDATMKIALENYPNVVQSFMVKNNDYYAYAFKKASAFDGIIQSVWESINKTFIKENRWIQFVKGLGTTFLITITSIILGIILGFLVFLLCKDGNKVSNIITSVCKYIVDGMPAVVLLMIFYYIVFSAIEIDGIIVSVVVFTLIFMSSVFGILHMAYDMIDTGQFEASYALGYSKNKTFFKIILPQMIRHMWISLEQSVVEQIKATSIVGFIAVQDLTKTSDMIRSSTYEAFFPLIVVAILYFFICWLFIRLVKLVSKKFNKPEKRREKFLSDVKTE